jgi:hypothetical protein
MMLIIRKYKNSRTSKTFFEYKFYYKDFYSKKMKCKRKKGFHSRLEAEAAAKELMQNLGRQPQRG